MAVFEKKGEPGWVDIQNIMVPVSLALVTFHNNILQQEKIMLRVTDQEKESYSQMVVSIFGSLTLSGAMSDLLL